MNIFSHPTQMKKANFDVSHELDEFMMVEKPLTHSKRKAHPDLEKMKPELRQMEEEYVHCASFPPLVLISALQVHDIRLLEEQSAVILPTQPASRHVYQQRR